MYAFIEKNNYIEFKYRIQIGILLRYLIKSLKMFKKLNHKNQLNKNKKVRINQFNSILLIVGLINLKHQLIKN